MSRNADESICIGSLDHSKTNPFLDIELLVQTAIETGCDAVHPGYGYLSENARCADRVREAALIFVGLPGSAILTLGDKRSSKEVLRAKAPEVPMIPGFAGTSLEAEDLERAAAKIGFPVMLKASVGGGGKGMRVVSEAPQLMSELVRAQSEVQRSFSADCILEKYIENSKHVEIQIGGSQRSCKCQIGDTSTCKIIEELSGVTTQDDLEES